MFPTFLSIESSAEKHSKHPQLWRQNQVHANVYVGKLTQRARSLVKMMMMILKPFRAGDVVKGYIKYDKMPGPSGSSRLIAMVDNYVTQLFFCSIDMPMLIS